MGRILEFALATTMIIVIQLSFAFWVATTVGNRIAELFETIIVDLPF
jgi:hypothetical protein